MEPLEPELKLFYCSFLILQDKKPPFNHNCICEIKAHTYQEAKKRVIEKFWADWYGTLYYKKDVNFSIYSKWIINIEPHKTVF